MSEAYDNAMEMSDEDFLDTAPSRFEPLEQVQDTSNDDQGDGVVESQETSQEASDEASVEEEESNEEEVLDDDEPTGEEAEQSEADEDEVGEEESEEEGEQEEVVTEDSDLQTQMDKLLSPFKANGTEMKVQNVDEAIKLMQMGANYTKKMTALKPNLKMLKMLENNKLLSEEKLNQLIDVASGNKEAIIQLIKDNEIDPLDINIQAESKYTPKNHAVGDNEVELDEVMSRIQDTTTFADTMNYVTNWDDASKSRIAGQPQLLETINDHVSNGVYAKVQAEVTRRKTFGLLSNLSDVDAYNQVGYEMAKEGAFSTAEPAKPKVIRTAPKPISDDSTKSRKKAAAPAKKAAPSKQKDEYDPLAMSDEEFEKLLN